MKVPKPLWILAVVLLAAASVWIHYEVKVRMRHRQGGGALRELGSIKLGEAAPDFAAPDLSDNEITLAGYRGQKVVLLDFWATWCGPCMRELPHVKQVYDELHPRGFEVLGISFDRDRNALEKVVREQNIPWPQSFASNGENPLGRQFGIDHFPSMWLVDQKGLVRFISAGADLRGKVLKLMQESPTTPSLPAIVPPPPPTKPAAAQHLRLSGFSGTQANPLILVNSGRSTHTFGIGDEQLLQTPGGELKVRCVSIIGKKAKFVVGDSGFELELMAY